jgi:hypothetical protein
VAETADGLVCGYHLAILRPARSRILGRFLFRWLQARPIRVQLELASTGVTRFGLPKNEVGDLFGTKSATVHRNTNSYSSFELRSWIDNCIVPILVKEYFAKLESEKNVDVAPETVTNFGGEVNPSTEART